MMMTWFKGKKPRDNRGSTIIVVLVAMTFLTVLASILLYLSLINLQMKKLDKAGKANFYSAEAVMNEIRAGVQEEVSDAIKEAYTDVLVSYNTTSEDVQISTFRNLFFSKFAGSKVGTLTLFPSAGTYDPGVLEAFVSADLEATVSGSGVVNTEIDGATGLTTAIILKNVSVVYINRGFETSVTADIKVQAPDLPYTSTTSRQTAIPDFAIVARGTLQQEGGGGIVSIYGNVYAGAVDINGAGNVFNVQNAPYFVSGGPVTISAGAMSLNINSSLWTGDIRLEAGGAINLDGDAYVANDLNLFGNDTQAILSGRYFGYGNSVSDPNASSSIIINGKHTVLDMSDLRALLLAGHSFVNFGTTNGYVMMGESVSVKSNQLAYLVPDDCLKNGFTNPYEYTGTEPDSSVLQNAVDLSIKVNGKDLSTYGITSPADDIKYIHKTVGTTNLIYFCFNFPDNAAANAYFKDYYNAKDPMMLKYLDLYSDGIILSSSSTKNLAGEAFTFNEGANKDGAGDADDVYGPVIDATNVPQASIEEISSSYYNLCVTLSRTDSASGYESAYDYFINEADMSALIGTEYFPSEQSPKAVVTNGDYIINATTESTIHIIIASGDVIVSGNYSGLIMAGGDVTLRSGTVAKASRAAVADALQQLVAGSANARYYRYLNPEVISPMNVSTSETGQSEVWDMDRLVIYENWKKNES